jgi:hypothetical protein
MPLITFDSLDLVPDGLKEVAKAIENGDGKVTVNVVPTSKVDEFRDKNIALSKAHDDLSAKYTSLHSIVGDNPEDFAKSLEELRVTQQRVKDGDLKEGRQIEEALAKRTEELRKDYDTRIQTLSKEGAAWQDRYKGLDSTYRRAQIAAAVKDAIMDPASGVEPSAASDIINGAYGTFRIDDHGKIIPYEGEAVIYGADGVSPMTPKEWIGKLKESKPFFFKNSNGGGADGATSSTKKINGMDPKVWGTMSASQRLEYANAKAAQEEARKRAAKA